MSMPHERSLWLNETEAALPLPLRLASGQLVDLYDLPPAALSVETIAGALSRICRFGGHVFRAYSVAEHSILVAALVGQDFQLEALLHDAAEAFCGDVVSPIKRRLQGFDPIEDMVADQIADHHGLVRGFAHSPFVKAADLLALKLEQHYLQGRELDVEVSRAEHAIAQEVFGPVPGQDRSEYMALLFCEMYRIVTASRPRLQ